MNLATWLRIAAILVGALALTLLIWFGGPFVAFGEVRPFESFWVRLPIAIVLMLGALGWIAWIVIKRRRAVAALSEAMGKEEAQAGDGAALSAAMRDALATLRRTRGKDGGDYLYDLPWYVIIGPPGAGKTTALVNSGLKFPLARGGQAPAAVAGAGGTRYCDWWFAEEAVLIDTAGRYTTQDTDTRAERTSWLAFLDLLKANRPRQPINGVMVAISVEDLLTSSQDEITAHAEAIRARLLELNERLKVDFPVYAVFTKADLIAGFNEFFGALSDRLGRRPVYLFGAAMTALWAYPLFWLLDTGSPPLVWLALIVAFVFSHAAMYGPQAAFLSELFGTRVRYSGASLGAQLAAVLAGGTSPFIATLLLANYGTSALVLYVMAMAIVTIVAVILASETHQRDIT